ncbi:MAG: alpha/beta hydrolase [Chloroflexi bacterium]|nr:alpha/beta hydrolase [Chloroflexota bacterium]
MNTGTPQGTDRFVRVGSLRLHYLEWGAPGVPAVVMVHGLTGNAHNFDLLAPAFLPAYRVLSLDVRGRGDSDWAQDADYTTRAYVGDLEGLRVALALERLSLIGTSMGGRISLAYAGLYPQRVERLVLNDIGPEVDPRGAARIFGYVAEAPGRFQRLDEVADWYHQNYPFLRGLGRQELLAYAGYAVRPDPAGGLTWKMDPAVRQALSRPQPEDAWAWARAITAPTLLIRGAESDILSPAIAHRMVAEMKSCRLAEVPGVGHAPSLAEPQALSAIKELFGLA